METFTFFWQAGSPFSQWHRTLFTENGFVYTCTEQYMMHHKALLMKDTETASKIMAAGYNPKEHKRLGRMVKPFDAKLWESKRRDIVYQGNYLKFLHPNLHRALASTRGTTLVEASPYDRIWGIGLPQEDPRAMSRSTWRGQNLLGEILTELRINMIGE